MLFCACIFLGGTSLFAEEVTLGGKNGWTQLQYEDNITRGKGRYGYECVELATNSFVFDEYTDICLSKGCCGGKKMIVFDMNGGIYPCELTDFPEQCLGSVFQSDNSLKNIIYNSLDTSAYFRVKTSEKCNSCPWYCYCRGGCTVRILSSKEGTSGIDEIECAINQALYPEVSFFKSRRGNGNDEDNYTFLRNKIGHPWGLSADEIKKLGINASLIQSLLSVINDVLCEKCVI